MPFFCALFAPGHFYSPFESAIFRSPFESGPLLPPGPFGELRLEEEGRGESGRETCPRRHNHTTQPTQPHAQPTHTLQKTTQPRTSYTNHITTNILHNPHQKAKLNYATQNATKRNPLNRNPQQQQTKTNNNPQAHRTIHKKHN